MAAKVICVTGTPAAGKSTFAQNFKRTAATPAILLDITEIVTLTDLHSSYNKELATHEIDQQELVHFLHELILTLNEQNYATIIIDGHMSHYLPQEIVDVCYVLSCSLKELQQRLKKRKYSSQKIQDNLQAEIFQTCLIEAEQQGHNITQVDTSARAKKTSNTKSSKK